MDEVELGWVLEVGPLDVRSGCVEPVALELEPEAEPEAPAAGEVVDELPIGEALLSATPLGLTPPTLITVETPPVDLRLGLTGAVLTVEVGTVVEFAGEDGV